MCRWPLITSFQCTYLNMFFLETTRLIELKFYMEYALDKKNILHFVSEVTLPKCAPCPYITGGNVVRGDQKLCKRSPYESVQI